ncbi:unnamed protein product, partial [Linum tenue]
MEKGNENMGKGKHGIENGRDEEATGGFEEVNGEEDKPFFELGMVFTNIREVRAAANKHSITECKDLKFKKNEAKRFRAVCRFKGCQFLFFVSYDRSINRLQLKTLTEHTCSQHWRNSRVRAEFIAMKYKRTIRCNPRWKLR